MSVYHKLNQELFGYLREFYTYTKIPLKKGKPKKKFLIFGRGRSGSTLLVSLMNSSPDIFCDKEILNRKVLNLYKYIDSRSQQFDKKIYGFKLLSYQLRSVQKVNDPHSFFNKLLDDGYEIVFLVRENILRQTLSKLYASYRSTWHEKNASRDSTQRIQMKVDPINLLKYLEESKKLEEYEYDLMSNVPHFKVSYEKDLMNSDNHKDLADNIAHYLNIEKFEPQTDLRKITTKGLSGFISNGDEIRDYLVNTPFNKYL